MEMGRKTGGEKIYIIKVREIQERIRMGEMEETEGERGKDGEGSE